MQELLKISYEAENPTVSARELHDQLNIGTKFTTWFQRMTEYGFSENTDYKTCYPNLGSENHGGQNMVDYQISVDMAKEICMIQRSPEGKRIRQYFIDLEKAWNTPERIFARALKMADKTIEELKHNNAALLEDNVRMKPKEVFADAVATSQSTSPLRQEYRQGRIFRNDRHDGSCYENHSEVIQRIYDCRRRTLDRFATD